MVTRLKYNLFYILRICKKYIYLNLCCFIFEILYKIFPTGKRIIFDINMIYHPRNSDFLIVHPGCKNTDLSA